MKHKGLAIINDKWHMTWQAGEVVGTRPLKWWENILYLKFNKRSSKK